MNVPAIALLIWFGLAASAAAQGTASGQPPSSNGSSAQLSEIRALVHELQARTEKLADLMAQYRSLVEQRPQAEGGSPEAKKAHQAQLERWNAALERLLRRIETARAGVVEKAERLQQLATFKLPTALAKDVANARNEAEAQRTAADQALTKNKAALSRTQKRAAQPKDERPAPPIPDDL